jgi:hypothetical protein
MDYWTIYMQRDLKDWLLDGEPWVTYHMLTDILGSQESERRVLAARKSILEHRLVKKILDKRNADGYWGVPKDIHTWWPKKDTTFWVLGSWETLG